MPTLSAGPINVPTHPQPSLGDRERYLSVYRKTNPATQRDSKIPFCFVFIYELLTSTQLMGDQRRLVDSLKTFSVAFLDCECTLVVLWTRHPDSNIHGK